MSTSDEQNASRAGAEVNFSSSRNENLINEDPINEIVVDIPLSQNSESTDVCIAQVVWERLSNFHDVAWLFDTNNCLSKTEGNPLSVGASRTYMTGGTETVLQRDEARRFLQWNLDSVKDYIASFEVLDTHIQFKNEGRLSKTILSQAKRQLTAKLTRVVAESEITEDDVMNIKCVVDCLDKYTGTLLEKIPETVLKQSSKITTADVIPEPRLRKSRESSLVTFSLGGKYSFKILPEDDYYGPVSLEDKLKLKVLESTWLYPVKDEFLEIPEHLVEKFRAYYKFDKCFPPSDNTTFQFNNELDSDESISEMAFYGVMSMWIKDDNESDNNKDGFMCDYSIMTGLKPRAGFRRLGAKAYFDSNRKLVRILDCKKSREYTPDTPGWEQAKMLLKVSAGQWNTCCDHLLGVHVIATNTVITAAVQNLSLTHPIRRLIQPFSFRSVYINNRAMDTLLSDGSLIIHACGYHKEELMKLLQHGFERCEMWGTPEERISNAGPNIQKLSDEGKFPYGRHSIALYKCFETFVANSIELVYESDADVKKDSEIQNFARYLHDQLFGIAFAPPSSYATKGDVIKVISTFMFNATGMHEYVGTVSEYINTPKKLAFRLREGATTTDFQSWLIGMLLFSVTSVPMPKLLSEFNSCYTKQHEQEEWTKCLDNLKELSTEMEKENQENLEYPFKSFDPNGLECSVNL